MEAKLAWSLVELPEWLQNPSQLSTKGTHTFAEKGMTSSAIWARFTSHLKAMDMYNGESVHSARRGSK
ncbi:hypothetical protein WJX79_009652 [Trebouxia sp. C0005]